MFNNVEPRLTIQLSDFHPVSISFRSELSCNSKYFRTFSNRKFNSELGIFTAGIQNFLFILEIFAQKLFLARVLAENNLFLTKNNQFSTEITLILTKTTLFLTKNKLILTENNQFLIGNDSEIDRGVFCLSANCWKG